MQMEAEITSKICLTSYHTARRHIPEDSNVPVHQLEDIGLHDILRFSIPYILYDITF